MCYFVPLSLTKFRFAAVGSWAYSCKPKSPQLTTAQFTTANRSFFNSFRILVTR